MKSVTLVDLKCNTQATANTAVTGLTAQLVNKGIASLNPAPVALLDDLGVWTVRAGVWFNTRADADSYHTWAAAEMANAKILTGSRITKHECAHDGANVPCVVDTVASK